MGPSLLSSVGYSNSSPHKQSNQMYRNGDVQFPPSSSWDPSSSLVDKEEVDTCSWSLTGDLTFGTQALEFEPLFHSSQQVQ